MCVRARLWVPRSPGDGVPDGLVGDEGGAAAGQRRAGDHGDGAAGGEPGGDGGAVVGEAVGGQDRVRHHLLRLCVSARARAGTVISRALSPMCRHFPLRAMHNRADSDRQGLRWGTSALQRAARRCGRRPI